MGPLHGLKIVELAALGPAPFCAMMLADFGAEVIRVDRPEVSTAEPKQADCTLRNRRSITLDLKKPEAVEVLLRLIDTADALLEGYRPGVAERLGIGPDTCLRRNPKLVYGRMTGWGQTGPLASTAGRDINYVSLTGVLHMIGEPGGKPVPPLNLVGDTGGGGMLLLAGILAALIQAGKSGQGQVIDAAMIDGAQIINAFLHNMRHTDANFSEATGQQMLAGAAPFYGTYETLDRKYVAVGAIDSGAFKVLLDRLGLDVKYLAAAHPAPRTHWAEARRAIAEVILTKTRDEWVRITEGSECCLTPVLTMTEAMEHPQNKARGTFIDVNGITQPAPAPRFSRTPTGPVRTPRIPGADTQAVLRELGVSEIRIGELQKGGALG